MVVPALSLETDTRKVVLFEDRVPEPQDAETIALYEEHGLTRCTRAQILEWAREYLARPEQGDMPNRLVVAQVIFARSLYASNQVLDRLVAKLAADMETTGDEIVADFHLLVMAEARGFYETAVETLSTQP